VSNIDLRNHITLCAKKKEAKHALHKKARNSSTISYSPKIINVLKRFKLKLINIYLFLP